MKFTISPDRTRLKITATKSERKILREIGDEIHADNYLHDVFEGLICNSELEWIDPSETGDLTSAPMLGILGEEGIKDITVFLPNHGLRQAVSDGSNTMVQPILERWAFMDYQVRSVLEDLRDKGDAVFVGGN